ncbi:response regulator with CheY-like receiver, AAA-type ATPase, and DNA-binding domains [Shewanella psychrophila]|uniref:Response regulator with CheY-like receiver, AAA-type ATPase, and DNA-binding domains n=1 Tax=Shewanella psychrophila TaxID=225848 RepID=A0A1S6HJD4_9GAMM|nr:sigma-54 dependent transcriptional regulator [Shewanella psychrophila]AQS35632.1 response regulator with CheY-like receiver, AAA-type ATPase, and DNA-binding domains [Shewanella psychrophila]
MKVERLKILVVEDEPDQRSLISQMLEANNYQITSADSVEGAIVSLKQDVPDLVFSDWKLGQLSGMDLLTYVRREHPDMGFIIATAYGTITHAVDAMQAGADDYLAKPYQRQSLLLAIEKVAKSLVLKKQNRRLTSELSQQQELVGIVGKAPCMQKVYSRVQRVSATDATVLIGGESGTGKELAARALYQLSQRKHKPFIAINCGSIPESLAESELFGAEKGAYTGATSLKIGKLEAANGGTIFLDEIGELPLLQQTNLLRFLQEGLISRLGQNGEIKLDVRVIAATHRDLKFEVEEGRFREDLYYRLNVVPIHMPPLRERQEDIGRLVEHFLKLHSGQYKMEQAKLSANTLKQLLDHPWPGNVRELSNRIERFVLLGDEEEMLEELSSQPKPLNTSQFSLPEEGIEWEVFEKDCLEQAMNKHQGNRTKAAKFLGLSYKAFLYRLEKYQLV